MNGYRKCTITYRTTKYTSIYTHTHTLAPSLNLIAYTQNHQTNKIGKALETKAIQTETNGFVFEIQKLI